MSNVKNLLTQAYQCLPIDMKLDAEASLATFEDYWIFLGQHEWELAMETLEELAGNMNLPINFWHFLSKAARAMNSIDNLRRYEAYLSRPII